MKKQSAKWAGTGIQSQSSGQTFSLPFTLSLVKNKQAEMLSGLWNVPIVKKKVISLRNQSIQAPENRILPQRRETLEIITCLFSEIVFFSDKKYDYKIFKIQLKQRPEG